MAVDIVSEIAVRLGLDTDGLANDVKGTTKVINELSKQFKYLDKAMFGSMNEIDRLGDITKTLTAKLDASKNAFKEVQKTVSQTQEEINRLIAEKRQLNAANESEAQQIKEIDARLEEYNRTLETSRQQATRLATTISSTEKDLQRYETRLANTQKGLDLFGRAAQELGVDIKELAQQLNFDIDTANIKTLQTALSTLKSDANSLTPEVRQLIDQFTQLGNRSRNTAQDINRLGDEVQQVNQRMDMSIAVDALGEISDIVGETSRKIVDFAKDSTLSFADFETTVVGAVMKTDDGLQVLDESMTGLVELGAKFPVTNQELATSFDDLSASGYKAADSLEILEGSLNVSMAVGEELEAVVAATSSSYALMGSQVENVAHLQDIMAKGANLGKISFEELGTQLVKAGGNANVLGMEVEEVVAVLAEMTNEGLSAQNAGDKLNSMLRQLAKPSKNAAALLSELNVEVFDSQGKFRGFTTVMEEINKATADYSEKQKVAAMNTLFGADASSAAASFMAVGTENTKQYAEALKDTTGYVDDLTQAIKDNTASDEIQGLVGAFDSLKAAVGEALLPILQEVLPVITNMVQGFLDLPDPIKNTIIIFGTLVGIIGTVIASITPLLMNIMMLQTILGGGFGAGAAVGALGAVGGAISGLGTKILALIGGPITLIISAIAGIVTALGTNVDVLQWLKDEWGIFGQTISAILESLAGVVQLTIGNIIILIMTLGEMMIAVLTGKWTKIDDIWSKGWAKIENNTAVAMSNIAGETTTALGLMETMTQTQMNGITGTFDVALKELANLTADNASKIADSFVTRMGTLDNDSITILRGTSDTMAVLFEGIYEDMTNDEAHKKFTANLESMAKSGKYPMEEIEKDIAKAMETIDKNIVDGSQKVQKSAEKVFSEFGSLAQVGVDEMVDNVSASISKMDAKTVDQLSKMGGTWGEIFNNLTINGKEKISNLDEVVTARIKEIAEKNPEFISQMEQEMTEYFAKTAEGAEEGLSKTANTVNEKGEEIKTAGKEVGKETQEKIAEGLKDTSGVDAALNETKTKVENADLETSGKTAGKGAGKGINEGIKEGSQGTEETVDSIHSKIMEIDNVKLGNVTKQLSEVNRWCGVVSTASGNARTEMQKLTNLPFGNTTKGLSETNKWLTTVNKSAKNLQTSLKSVVAVTYGPTTKGLSEIDKWLKTCETASKHMRNGLKGINNITYGSTTKGLSEINKWLTTCKTSANALTTSLRNISNVRFSGTISSLNSLKNALQNVANQASKTKTQVSQVKSARFVVSEDTSVQNPEIPEMANVSTFRDNIDVLKAAQNDIIGTFAKSSNVQSVSSDNQNAKLLNEQITLMKAMINTMQDMYQDVILNVDGRQIAKATARYMQPELKSLESRSSRLGTIL